MYMVIWAMVVLILGMSLDAVLCFSDELHDKDPSLSMLKTDWSIGV